MTGGTAVEEGGVRVVDNLSELEGRVLLAGSEGSIGGLVAKLELRRLGHGVVVGTPAEQDGVADGGVDGEGHVAEDTLGGRDDDGVGRTSALAARVGAVVRALSGRGRPG